jgi:stage III sporulation protein AB
MMSRIMEMMMSEIRYSKATLPECCRSIGERIQEPYRGAFLDVYRAMRENTGEEFGQVFRRRMEECLKTVPAQKKEKELFLRFAAESGFEDGDMQLSSIVQYQDLLKDLAAGLEREVGEKSRMALGLGAMGGLLLVIVLL